MTQLYIGLMSGTSLDGIDASLVEFNDKEINLIAFGYSPFSDSLKNDIRQLSQPNIPILLKKYGSLDFRLGELFAQASNNLLAKANIPSESITAIGSHGQTVYHSPNQSFSLQIGDPNIIAEKTGITTIADFRRRDIAAGGQGAPLVPAFHQAIFSQLVNLDMQAISIVNIGGIANITYLAGGKTIGFDTGPGNALIDHWTQKHLKTEYDKNGDWAKKGTINTALVSHLKNDPYFKLIPPKSTGKEYFSPDWLEQKTSLFPHCSAEDIQASLCELTAETITDNILQYAPLSKQTLVCGGGVHNQYLISLIKKKLTYPVTSTAAFGINPDHVEAMAFAWLARQTMSNLPGNLTETTGAIAPVILGGIYPGKKGLN